MKQQKNEDKEREHQANMRLHGFGPEVMKRLKVCPHCGSMEDAAKNTCTHCGKRINGKTLFDLYRRMHPYCPLCGTVAPDGAGYCPKCGREIQKQSPKKDD